MSRSMPVDDDSSGSDPDYVESDPSEFSSGEDEDLCEAASDTVVESSPLSEDDEGDGAVWLASSQKKGPQLPGNPGYVPATLYGGNVHPPSYYQQKIKDCDEVRFKRKQYARKTTRALNRILEVWKQYCIHLKKPWRTTMEALDLRHIESFIHFHLNQREGKDGRRRRGTKITRSLRTFWDEFRLLYRREILADIDWKVDRNAVNNLLVRCFGDFKLSAERKENRPMTLDNLKLQIETTLKTTEKSFKLGEQRILAVLFLLLLAPAGSRPESILQIRYRDIDIALHQPKEGPAQLMIFMKLEFTKTYLGEKGVKTFIVPEVIYDPSLFLSPHVFLLAILFRRRAFLNDRLNNNPAILAQLKVRKEKQLPLPLKSDLDDHRIFASVVRDEYGYVPSTDGITYSTMSKWLQCIGRILGWETNATPYTLRYMAGNNMNECVNISSALQNLVMDHAPNSDTFQRNYLNRNVTFDLWALHRGLEPQQAVVREAASFGYRQISDRPMTLTDEQNRALKDDPEYKYYEDRLKTLQKGTPEYKQARLDVRAALERLRYAATKRSIGKAWTKDYAFEEIEDQLDVVLGGPSTNARPGSGGRVARRQRPDQPMSPSQKKMVAALYQPMQTSLEEQLQRRTAAIAALIDYCSVQEPIRTNLHKKSAPPVPPIMLEMPQTHRLEEEARLRRDVFVDYEGQRLRYCYMCIGDALTRAPDDPGLPELCRRYSSSSSLARHFRRGHLQHFKMSQLPPCPICIPKIQFKDVMYLQSHAQEVHGIYQPDMWTG